MGNWDYLAETTGRLAAEIGYTCRIKIYPDGFTATAANRAVFRRAGWESDSPRRSGSRRDDIPEEVRAKDNAERSRRRAAAAMRDLALSNDWKYFVTFTLDRKKIDRYDAKAVTRKLNQWLDNRVRRKGLRYLIVPELHKDGALHYHGLVNDCLPVEDSGTISRPGDKKPRKPRSKKQRAEWIAAGGHIVYNMPDWTLGFSTAIELYGERMAAINYVAKYITKAESKCAGRWYYHSNNLLLPHVLYSDYDIDSLEADAAAYLLETGVSPDVIPQQLGRKYSQVQAINLTLFTHSQFLEGENENG